MFKVGDKVRVLADNWFEIPKGSIQEIYEIRPSGYIMLEGISDVLSFDPDFFELVEDNMDDFEPTKSYLIEHKNEYVGINENGRLERFDIWVKNAWDCFDENMQDINGEKQYDIEKIYKKVWTRVDTSEIEKQIRQIEQFLDFTKNNIEYAEKDLKRNTENQKEYSKKLQELQEKLEKARCGR